jgi:hypothetical protein
MGGDLTYAQLFHQPTELRWLALALKLFKHGILLTSLALKNAVAVAVYAFGKSILARDSAHQQKVSLRILVASEQSSCHLACSIVYRAYKTHPGASALQPVVRAAVKLQHRSLATSPLPPRTVLGWAPGLWTCVSCALEDPADR